MPSGVYVITNTRDSKRYVGVSADIESRWGGHRSDLRAENITHFDAAGVERILARMLSHLRY